MLRSSDRRAHRHNPPLPDNGDDAGVNGSTNNADANEEHHGEDESLAEDLERTRQNSLVSNNALQESAYRLQALVKRNSPQKPVVSPIRFNKTEPLPQLDINSTSRLLKKAIRTNAPSGGISKAPPSPRRSPLRRDVHTESLSGAPQTKNVVERMIAYARHAASHEDPNALQLDKQRFTSRLADRLGAPEDLQESQLLSSSAGNSSLSGSAYPIVSNLSMHANLKKQQRRQHQEDEEERPRREYHTAPVAQVKDSEDRLPSIRPTSSHYQEGDSSREHTGNHLSSARHDAAPVDLLASPPPTGFWPIRSATTPSALKASNDLSGSPRSGSARTAQIAYNTLNPPSTPPERGRDHSSSSRTRVQTLGQSLGAANAHRGLHVAPKKWNKEEWRVFSEAVHASLVEGNATAQNAVQLFNSLMHRLPTDMREMPMREMVQRLNAWVRNTSKLARQ